MKWPSAGQVMLLAMFSSVPGQAQEVCAPDATQAAVQRLRRLSLDLRGKLPTVTEMTAVAESGAVSEETVDRFLASVGFLHQVRIYHRDLLWASLTRQRLANNNWMLRPGRGANTPWFLPSQARQLAYRGGRVSCLNQPATFARNGSINVVEEPDPQDPNATVRREGYVEVAPYWAPNTTIRVCAFDAQTNEQGVNPRNGAAIACTQGINSPECGCGPNLRGCFTSETELAITTAMTDQMLETLEGIVETDQPYTDAILGETTVINGPLVHYYRYQTNAGGNFIAASPQPALELPDRTFTQSAFVPAAATAEHAGVLTLPGYLMRFQSDRGRANRFFQAFMCQSFQAPSGGLPAADDPCQQEPDLTQRCGCQYCHQTLEPASAHWGRWSEAGIMHLDPAAFPRVRPQCATDAGANTLTCKRFYLTTPGHPKEEPYKGTLLSYVFGDEHPDRVAAIEAGPRALAQTAVSSGRFALCTTTKVWTWLMGRPPRADESPILGELAAAFEADGYRFKGLVKALVSRPEYVEAGEFGEEAP